jgi:hypothetical protein
MERKQNDADRGKARNSEKNPSQCHSVHHKFHTDCYGAERGFSNESASNEFVRGTIFVYMKFKTVTVLDSCLTNTWQRNIIAWIVIRFQDG